MICQVVGVYRDIRRWGARIDSHLKKPLFIWATNSLSLITRLDIDYNVFSDLFDTHRSNAYAFLVLYNRIIVRFEIHHSIAWST